MTLTTDAPVNTPASTPVNVTISENQAARAARAARFSLKNIRRQTDEDGYPMTSATLYCAGKKAAAYQPSCTGGESTWQVFDAAAYAAFQALVASVAPTICNPFPDDGAAGEILMPYNADMLMEAMINYERDVADLTKKGKQGDLFASPHMKAGTYRVAKRGDAASPERRAYILAKFPDSIFAADDFDTFIDLTTREA